MVVADQTVAGFDESVFDDRIFVEAVQTVLNWLLRFRWLELSQQLETMKLPRQLWEV